VILKKFRLLLSGGKKGWDAVRFSRGVLFVSVIVVSFLPLVLFRGLANPFVFGRTTIMRLLVVFSMVPLLLLWKRLPETRPRQSVFLWTTVLLLFFAVVSGFLGIDPLRSFAGDVERVDGIFTALAFGVFFLVVQTLLRTGVRWERLWDVQIAVGMLSCLLAILRLLFVQTRGRESQLMGTLGNPAFFGEYLLALLACVCMRLTTTVGRRRWLHGIVASIFLATAVWSQIRGVFVGVFVSVLLLCVVYRKGIVRFFRMQSARQTVPMIVVSAFVLVAVLTVAVRAGSFSRVRALAHPLQEPTVQQRFLLWRSMGEAFLARPWFGWGDQNQIAAFYQHVPPTLWAYTSEVFDRSHNVLFDVLVTGGLFGFMVTVGVLLGGWYAVRRALATVAYPERLAIGVGLCVIVGYAVSLLFLFHTQAATWILVLFAALVADRGGEPAQAGIGIPGLKTHILVGAFSLVFLWVGVVQPGSAAVLSARTMRLFATDPRAALLAAEQGYAMHSALSREFVKYFAGRLVTAGTAGVSDLPTWTQSAIFSQHALLEEAARHRWDPSPLLVLAGLEDIWSNIEPVAGISGVTHLEKGLAKHVESTDGRLRLALLLTKAWQGRVALHVLHTARETTPQNPYWFRTLGLVYGLLGQRDAAEAAFEKTNEVTARFFSGQRAQTERELNELRNRIRGVPLMHHVPVL
jgi:O-antigen ligase